MATTLHQQLKAHYVNDPDRHEVHVDGYRIDAVADDGRLVEIQCASLSAIQDKIRQLTKLHRVTVVKPLAARRKLLKKERRNGKVVSSRYSPVHESFVHLFLDLVHFTGAFPHPNLQLDVLLTEQEEIRVPTKRKSWRRRFSVQDRRLTAVEETISVRTAEDLWQHLNTTVPVQFTTADLSETTDIPRWLAQKTAWCFRQMEFFTPVARRGNSIVYSLTPAAGEKKAA